MSNAHVHPAFRAALASIAPPEYDDGARWQKLVRMQSQFEPAVAVCQWDDICKEWIPVVSPEKTIDGILYLEDQR